MKNLTKVVCILTMICTAELTFADSQKRQLAEDYLVLSKTKETIDITIDTYATQLAAQNPRMDEEKFRNVLNASMGWSVIKEPTVELVTNIFTEEELRDIVSFYKSKSGSSYANKSPLISAELSTLISTNFKKAMANLQ